MLGDVLRSRRSLPTLLARVVVLAFALLALALALDAAVDEEEIRSELPASTAREEIAQEQQRPTREEPLQELEPEVDAMGGDPTVTDETSYAGLARRDARLFLEEDFRIFGPSSPVKLLGIVRGSDSGGKPVWIAVFRDTALGENFCVHIWTKGDEPHRSDPVGCAGREEDSEATLGGA